ncbi:hypothetical protein MNV_260001 [Candidatus Methanoperedens nitroreducens]|uniref:Uncharacterized protein n=1 Tax=Candidatus Methanoperedens nitratireducens TaxID=1392998 RepID=A0A284VPU7_9EURY|nr:hypothetical protein MNV_260001 [Candidatus Methanoperedens nitroreducens]
MPKINVYKWEDIRKYFPPERVAEIRSEILELRKSGRYPDEELWKMYGMSECDEKLNPKLQPRHSSHSE